VCGQLAGSILAAKSQSQTEPPPPTLLPSKPRTLNPEAINPRILAPPSPSSPPSLSTSCPAPSSLPYASVGFSELCRPRPGSLRGRSLGSFRIGHVGARVQALAPSSKGGEFRRSLRNLRCFKGQIKVSPPSLVLCTGPSLRFGDGRLGLQVLGFQVLGLEGFGGQGPVAGRIRSVEGGPEVPSLVL